MSCDIVEIVQEMGMRSVAYAMVCFAIEQLSPFVSPLIIPGFNKLKEDKKKASNWYNRNVSFVHAAVMFVRAYQFWTTLENWQLNVSVADINNRGISHFESLTIDIMIGYLIYDTLYEFKSNKGVALMLAHHLVGFFSHVLTRLFCNGPASYYTMMIYLAELSTPFLNVSWLLSELNNAPTLLLLTGGMLVLTFFLSRVVVGPYLMYHMIMHWLPEGNEVLYYTNILIVVFFLLMNFYWFMQLLKRVMGPSSEKKKKSEKKTS